MKESRHLSIIPRGSTLFLFLLLFLCTLLILPSIYVSGEGDVGFSGESVTPGSGDSDSPFLFTVTVNAEKRPEGNIEIVIDGKAHPMKEIYLEDRNYSDGKDFYYRDKFKSGAMVYYFKCGNTTTNARTLSVTEVERVKWHIDVAFGMSLFIIPVIYAVIVFRRIERRMKEISETVVKIGDWWGKKRKSDRDSDSYMERDNVVK